VNATERPSGLRNPGGAVRGMGAGTLFMEAVVLLLTLRPIRVLSGGLGAGEIILICAFAAAAALLTGLLRWRWAWWAGGLLQVGIVAGGLLHWSLAAVGVVFGAVWLYVLHVRRTILGPPR
jgi:hypothetical protein